MQVPGGAAGATGMAVPGTDQFSVSRAASLDAEALLCVALCVQIEAQKAACQGLQILL